MKGEAELEAETAAHQPRRDDGHHRNRSLTVSQNYTYISRSELIVTWYASGRQIDLDELLWKPNLFMLASIQRTTHRSMEETQTWEETLRLVMAIPTKTQGRIT